ncbi:hypothetical protein AAVH_09199 [Aphelenchoides avenae]|nr:hypothetical protein AAVH_09199 [Aphelenchus avenae]
MDSESAIKKAIDELMSCESYWLRKTKLSMLSSRPGVTEQQLKAIEFDLALSFKDAKDVSRTVEQLYKMGATSPEVSSRLKNFVDSLSKDADSAFASEVMRQLSVTTFLDMYFTAHPESKTPSGAFKVYFTLISNNPASANTVGKKFFDSYSALREQFLQSSQSTAVRCADITPSDIDLFHLAKPLASVNFGDLAPEQISSVYGRMLTCCLEDSVRGIPDALYISPANASTKLLPRNCWHYCVTVLLPLLKRSGVQSPAVSRLTANPRASFTELAEWVAEDLDAKRDAPLLRLLLSYAIAKSPPLNDGTHHLVYMPGYLYNILPRNQLQYWVHNVERPRSFESCIESVKVSGLAGCAESLAIAHTVVSRLPVADADLRDILSGIGCENMLAFVARSFLFAKLSASPKEQTSLRLQQLQALIATKDLPAAFHLAVGFLKELSEDDVASSTPFPIQSAEDDAYKVVRQDNLPTYITLLLFNTFWCGYVRHFDNADSSALLLDSLIVFSQAVWEDGGYALWRQLIEHIKAKETFVSQIFLKYVNNTAMLADLCALKSTQISVVGSDEPMRGTELAKELRSGKLKPAEGPPKKLLFEFISVYSERLTQLLSK